MDSTAEVVITENGSVPGAVIPTAVTTSQGSCKPEAMSPGKPKSLLLDLRCQQRASSISMCRVAAPVRDEKQGWAG